MIFMNIIRSPVHFWTDCEKIYTIDRLCSILHCEIEDIVEHIPEPDEMNEKTDTKNYTSSSKDDKNSL